MDWQERAKRLEWKPNPVDVIPEPIRDISEDNPILFPLPPGRKGWSYPHGSEDYRYSGDSEILNAYLESGWGYGISCADTLVVIDIDDLDYINEVTDGLPETMYQETGSKSGFHFFYSVPGLDRRIILKDGDKHVGELKCDSRGYVVGPGSLHPSGNIYGPLQGAEMAEVKLSEFLYQLNNALPDSSSVNHESLSREKEKYLEARKESERSMHGLYSLDADDVLPSLTEGERVSNPVHGSTTGTNFMKNEGGRTFTCWRCQYGTGEGCVLAPVQYLAVEEMGAVSDNVCEEVKRAWNINARLHYLAWKNAVESDMIAPGDPPSRVITGYGMELEIIESGEEVSYEKFNAIRNALLREFRRCKEITRSNESE
jgi:hypothetical protein